MELQNNRTRVGSKRFHKGLALGFPLGSYNKSLEEHVPDSASRCSKIRYGSNSIIAKMIKLGESMDVFAQRIRDHGKKVTADVLTISLVHAVRSGPNKLSETVKGKLTWGARIIQVGGVEKIFKKKFKTTDDEKLFKAYQCYIYTTAGPIAGLLFVSSQRVAFCSNRSIKCSTASGKLLKLHYKVMIPLKKINRVNESENVTKPKQKYMQLVTQDDFDFWFMGFVNHQKTFNYLENAIHEAHKNT